MGPAKRVGGGSKAPKTSKKAAVAAKGGNGGARDASRGGKPSPSEPARESAKPSKPPGKKAEARTKGTNRAQAMLTMVPTTAGLSSIPAMFSTALVSPPMGKESQGPTQASAGVPAVENASHPVAVAARNDTADETGSVMGMSFETLMRRYRLTLKDGASRVLTGVNIIGQPGTVKSLLPDTRRIEDVTDIDRTPEVPASVFQEQLDQLLSYSERNQKELQRLVDRYQHKPETAELFKEKGGGRYPVFFVDIPPERFTETYGGLAPEYRAIFARAKLSDADKVELVAHEQYHEKNWATLPQPWDSPSSFEYAEPHVRDEAGAIAAGAIARDKAGEPLEPGSYSAFYLERLNKWLDIFRELDSPQREERAHEYAVDEVVWEIDAVRTLQHKGSEGSGREWLLSDHPPLYTSPFFMEQYRSFMPDEE